jgi:hypothetical protein
MVDSPPAALSQLRSEASRGVLERLCQDAGIELLVAFGSATRRDWPVPPHDLDLAVVMTGDSNVLGVTDALVTHLAFETIDVMDLDRAGSVARAQALGGGELLYETAPGTFIEQQILALVQQADTKWMRDLQLEALAR